MDGLSSKEKKNCRTYVPVQPVC